MADALTLTLILTLTLQVKHEILFDERLMPWALEWLVIMSMSTTRSVAPRARRGPARHPPTPIAC